MLKKLERIWLVRPNLGRPLILKPSELKRFTVTLAYHKPFRAKEDTVEWLTPSELHDFQLQLQSFSYFGITCRNITILLKVFRVYGYFKHPFFKDDYSHVRHPITSAQQQYRSGFRWEVKVDVGISDHDTERLQRLAGWPTLLNIDHWFDRTSRKKNHHAIYVHESLRNSSDFTILHITDTHIAKRNDLIPEILCQVRNKTECEDLKRRYVNFNDHLRAFIKEANRRVNKGENVIVVLTGDITDYYFDGYWDGKFVCGQGVGWPDRRKEVADSTLNSNMRKFVEIITGKDGKGEALKCPIFTVIGNHEYYANEILLNYLVGSSVGDVFTDAIKEREDYGGFFKFNPNNPPEKEEAENRAREYDFWAYPRKGGKIRSRAMRKTFKEVIRKKGSLGSVELYLMSKWRASLVDDWGDKSFWLIKPKSWILSQYLTEVNYDLDFELHIGKCHILLLNTGHDVYPSKQQIIAGSPLFAYDFKEGGPHARGITREHTQALRRELNSENEKLILVFTHAPLLQIRKVPEEKDIGCWYEEVLKEGSEDNHKKAMEVLRKYYEPLWEYFKKRKRTMTAIREIGDFLNPSLPEGCFKRNLRVPCLVYFSSEGCRDRTRYIYPHLADEFLALISREPRKTTEKPILVFSGHTHRVHEFRIEKINPRGIHFYFYIDNFSGKYFRMTENAPQLLYRYGYLKVKSPLLFTSDAIKNKNPKYREIVVRGLSLASLEMKEIPRIDSTADFTPGCYLTHLRAHNGQYVCAEEGGNKEFMANRNWAREWETFEIVKLGDSQVALKACNGKFVRAEGGGGGKLRPDRHWIKHHETFTLVIKGRNKIALQTHNGKYICAQGGGGQELLANRNWAREWETFEVGDEFEKFWGFS